MQLRDKVPNDSVSYLKESLDSASQEKIEKLAFLQVKNPITGLIFSLVLGTFGVDRFYKGDKGLGIAKILLFWGSYILLIFFMITSATNSFEPYSSFDLYNDRFNPYTGFEPYDDGDDFINVYTIGLACSAICLLLAFIWMLADIFLVFFGIKKDNLKKIFELLNTKKEDLSEQS
ncbi:hypothetical protein DMB92_05080 [Campylobacter sp. MIT 99-7217]|nr:hypothetical protein DMB92_05080 [Campylobacter sp. MIT 99-7217]